MNGVPVLVAENAFAVPNMCTKKITEMLRNSRSLGMLPAVITLLSIKFTDFVLPLAPPRADDRTYFTYSHL